MQKPSYVFFDLDKTLTRSKSLISDDMKCALDDLAAMYEVVVVSGAVVEQIFRQLTDAFNGKLWILAQNGNYALRKDGTSLWHNTIDCKDEIMNHICGLKSLLGTENEDMIQHRGCQISMSCVGHNADLAVKEKFDPDFSRRRKMLEKHPFVSDKFEVRIGGTTCFDYTLKGMNKGTNVKRLAETHGWNIDHCLYVGDALVPGGNDETVIGVCPTRLVSGPDDTYALVRELLSVSN